MIVLTQQSGGTHAAQIRSSQDQGFKVLYRASCTESDAAAARAVVRKYFGDPAAATVQRVPDKDIGRHVPSTTTRKRCNPVAVWTFTPKAR